MSTESPTPSPEEPSSRLQCGFRVNREFTWSIRTPVSSPEVLSNRLQSVFCVCGGPLGSRSWPPWCCWGPSLASSRPSMRANDQQGEGTRTLPPRTCLHSYKRKMRKGEKKQIIMINKSCNCVIISLFLGGILFIYIYIYNSKFHILKPLYNFSF